MQVGDGVRSVRRVKTSVTSRRVKISLTNFATDTSVPNESKFHILLMERALMTSGLLTARGVKALKKWDTLTRGCAGWVKELSLSQFLLIFLLIYEALIYYFGLRL